MCKIIVSANQKGGVGKTITCLHLAYVLAEKGRKVLVIDFDPQINLTTSLMPENEDYPLYNMNDLLEMLLNDKPLPNDEEYIYRTKRIDIIPGSRELHRQETALRLEMGSERFLSAILEPMRHSYDYIIIDTNRANSPLLTNALTAADSVLIPICPTYYSLEGLSDLITTLLKNRRRLNPRLAFEGILLSNCEERTRLFREIRAEVTEAFGKDVPIFRTAIPHTVQVEEAVRRGMTVLEYAPASKASKAFLAFGEEVIAHGNEAGAKENAQYGGNSKELCIG